jgi:hypothetical protein
MPSATANPRTEATSLVKAQKKRNSRDVRGFLHAPEKARTSTDHTVHKALNLDQSASIR